MGGYQDLPNMPLIALAPRLAKFIENETFYLRKMQLKERINPNNFHWNPRSNAFMLTIWKLESQLGDLIDEVNEYLATNLNPRMRRIRKLEAFMEDRLISKRHCRSFKNFNSVRARIVDAHDRVFFDLQKLSRKVYSQLTKQQEKVRRVHVRVQKDYTSYLECNDRNPDGKLRDPSISMETIMKFLERSETAIRHSSEMITFVLKFAIVFNEHCLWMRKIYYHPRILVKPKVTSVVRNSAPDSDPFVMLKEYLNS